MTTPPTILLLKMLTISSIKAMIRGYHSKLLGKNYLAKECKTDSENQFVVAVTKGKTIQVSHTCTYSKTLSSERPV